MKTITNAYKKLYDMLDLTANDSLCQATFHSNNLVFHHFKYSHAFQYSLSYRTSSPSGMFVPFILPLQPTPNLPNCTSVTKLSCPKQSFPLLEPTGSDYSTQQSQRVCEISFIIELLGSSIFQFFMYLVFISFQLYFRVLKDRYQIHYTLHLMYLYLDQCLTECLHLVTTH